MNLSHLTKPLRELLGVIEGKDGSPSRKFWNAKLQTMSESELYSVRGIGSWSIRRICRWCGLQGSLAKQRFPTAFIEKPSTTSGLSVRAFHVLVANHTGSVFSETDPLTKKQWRTNIYSKAIDLTKLRDCGDQTVREICHWAGINLGASKRLYPDTFHVKRHALKASTVIHRLRVQCKALSREITELKSEAKKRIKDDTLMEYLPGTADSLSKHLDVLHRIGVRPQRLLLSQDGVDKAILEKLGEHPVLQGITAFWVKELKADTYLLIHPNGDPIKPPPYNNTSLRECAAFPN